MPRRCTNGPPDRGSAALRSGGPTRRARARSPDGHRPARSAVAERVTHVVGDPPGDVDELVGPVVRPGHRRLQQVAVVVQLVAPLQVAVAGRLAGAPEHRVEVAVGLLGRGDRRRQAAEPLVGVGGPATTDLPRHRLHQLVDIGVGEHHPLVVAAMVPAAMRGEVGDPAESLHPPLAMGERRVGVDLLAGRPLPAGDLDLVEAERTQPARALGATASFISPLRESPDTK